LAFLPKTRLNYAKIVITTLVFEKNAIFCRKSQKIVVITSTPVEFGKLSPKNVAQSLSKLMK
jgi:hypothetical protein